MLAQQMVTLPTVFEGAEQEINMPFNMLQEASVFTAASHHSQDLEQAKEIYK